MKKLLLAVSLLTSLSVSAKWQHVEQIDPMTDLDTSFIMTADDDNTLAVRCDGGEADIIVNVGYIGSKISTIMARFDKNEPIYVPASPSTNGRAAFIDDDKEQQLIDGFKKHGKVAFLATDFRGSRKYGIFNLTGFTEQARKLSCLK